MERDNGVIALRTKPFTKVALRQNTALNVLSQSTREIFRANTTMLLENPEIQLPENSGFRNRLEKAKAETDSLIDPGGTSLSSEELNFIYRRWGNLTFNRIVGRFLTEVFPGFLENKSEREPGVVCLGYCLDLIRIINPKVASFDAGVQSVIDEMKHSDLITPFVLGAMVDDTINLSTRSKSPIDFLADKKGALQFKESYLKLADEGEKQDFERGFKITLHQLYLDVHGISLN